MGASTFWNPQGLSRLVMGLLYLYLITNFSCFVGRDSIVGMATTCEPAQGCGIYHPPLSSFEVKESAELYLYTLYRP